MTLPAILIQTTKRAVLLVGFLKLASVTIVAGDKGESEFRQEIFPVTYPMHVITEGSEPEPLGYDASHPQKAHIAPRVKCRSNYLTEPVFDVAEVMRSNGLKTPEGSRFLFSPSAGILFVSSTADDLTLAETITAPFPFHEQLYYSFDVLVLGKSHGKADRSIVDMKSLGFLSGQIVKLRVSGDMDFRLDFEPIVGPDGERVDTNLDASVRTHGRRIQFTTALQTAFSKSITAELGKFGNESILLQIKMHKEVRHDAPAPWQTPALKAEALSEIREALKVAP